MEMPLVLGRPFTDVEVRARRRVAVVNERFVRQFFEGENPVGKDVRAPGDGAY